MVAEHGEDSTPTDADPPLLDVSDRPAAAPGPLTKPSPTVRPQKRQRGKFFLAGFIVLAVALAAILFLPLLVS